MEVTSDYVIAYMKGLDLRAESKSDSSLLTTFNYGLTNLATQILCFTEQEQIDLSSYAGLSEITFTMASNVIDFYDCYVIDTATEEKQLTGFKVKYTNDKRVTLVVDNPDLLADFSLVVKYFYYPVLRTTNTITVEPEIWHYLKHSVQIVYWGGVKDYEKEQYHTKVLDDHLSQKIIGMPKDMAEDSMRGFV